MNICEVTPRYLPANLTGSEKYIQHLSEGLASKGHRVTVHTSTALSGEAFYNPFSKKFSPLEKESISGVNVVRHRSYSTLCSGCFILDRLFSRILPKSFSEIIEVLSKGPLVLDSYNRLSKSSCELIHASPFPLVNVWLAWRAARKAQIPFVCTPFFHPDVPGQESRFFHCYYNKHFKEILVKADAIIACTKLEKKVLVAQGADPTKVHVVPMGVHPKPWKNASGKRFRDKYRLGKKKIVLFAGIKGYNKGAVHLLQAMVKVQKLRKDVVLVAIGFPTKEWQEAKKKYSKVNIIDLGYKNGQEKLDIFDACDIFAMPSRSDAFGIVFLEAWMCGKPVIGARAGALPEVIRENTDGYLVDFGDIDALTQKIIFLLDNPELRKKLGREGKKKTLANFTWERVVGDTEKVFESVIS